LAPLFFIIIGLIIGYPVQLVFLYKTVNTLDSMVGYIQEPYKRVGFVSAKVDDLFNLIPARIGSFLMLLAGGILGLDLHNGRKIWRRDRLNHKSPNAGYPESAIAGLLDIQLGGTHTYFGEVLEKPTIGDPIRAAKLQDISNTCRVMYMSEFIMLMMGIVLLLLLK
jgi:adenosylcobinamide-phosphate synthase